MIFKKHEHIYYLKDKQIEPSWLTEKASEMGYEIIELDNVHDFIEIIETSEHHRPTAQQAHLFANNLHNESEKKYLTRLFDHMQWLIQTMNELRIGFMITNGSYPLMMNTTARDILQRDPEHIEQHPIREAAAQDHQESLTVAIKQLINKEIEHYKEDVQIRTPLQEGKNIQIHGKPLEVDGLPLIAEYIAEKEEEKAKKSQEPQSIPAMIQELHRILTGLSGIITLIYNKTNEVASNQQESKESQKQRYNLTRRETQILQFIYEGYTSQKIAEKLYISKRTVESHRANILHKTNAKNTADLIRFAIHHSLL